MFQAIFREHDYVELLYSKIMLSMR